MKMPFKRGELLKQSMLNRGAEPEEIPTLAAIVTTILECGKLLTKNDREALIVYGAITDSMQILRDHFSNQQPQIQAMAPGSGLIH